MWCATVNWGAMSVFATMRRRSVGATRGGSEFTALMTEEDVRLLYVSNKYAERAKKILLPLSSIPKFNADEVRQLITPSKLQII